MLEKKWKPTLCGADWSQQPLVWQYGYSKNSQNQDAAYAFINFMLKPESALKMQEYVGYSTPNLPAKELIPEEKKKTRPSIQTLKLWNT